MMICLKIHILILTCRCHFLTEEHKVDLVKGNILQRIVGVGDILPESALGPVQVTPVRQGGGAGGGVCLHQLITDLTETLNSPANHTEVSGTMILVKEKDFEILFIKGENIRD